MPISLASFMFGLIAGVAALLAGATLLQSFVVYVLTVIAAIILFSILIAQRETRRDETRRDETRRDETRKISRNSLGVKAPRACQAA